MRNRIQKYIYNNQQSYLGYYALGLDLLDDFLLSSKTNRDELCKNFEKTFELMPDIKHLKYCLVGLLIKKDIDTYNIIQNKIKKLSNTNKEEELQLIFKILDTLKNKETTLEIHEENHLDSIDHLCLHILHREHGIQISPNKNYLYEAVKIGRKTNKIKTALINEGPEHYDEFLIHHAKKLYRTGVKSLSVVTYITKYIKKNEITDVDFFIPFLLNEKNVHELKKLLDKRPIEEVTTENFDLIKKLMDSGIEFNTKKDLYNEFVDFRIFHDPVNKSRNEEIRKKSGDQWASRLLKKSHYSHMEVEYIKALPHSYQIQDQNEKSLKIRLSYIYELNINIPYIRQSKILFEAKFSKYKKTERFVYYTGCNNYYFFPEAPSVIKIICNKYVVESRGFSCESLIKQDIYGFQILNSITIFDQDLISKENPVDRFNLFIYWNKVIYVNLKNFRFIELLLSNNSIFDMEFYKETIENLFKRISASLSLGDHPLYHKIAIEKMRFSHDHGDPQEFHEDIMMLDDIKSIIVMTNERRKSGKEIFIHTYLRILDKLLKHISELSELEMINMGLIYESLVSKSALMNENIFRFLQLCYMKYRLNSEMTDDVINTIKVFKGNDVDAQKLVINSYVYRNNYNYAFYSLFKKLYSQLGAEDGFIKDIVNRMIHYKHSVPYEFIDILEDVYKTNQDDMVLLEEIIWQKMTKTKEISQEYLIKIKDHYINNNLFNSRTLKILRYMLDGGYKGFEKYFLTLFQYEHIKISGGSHTVYYRPKGKDHWNKIVVNKGQSKYCLQLGYCRHYEYKKEGGMVEERTRYRFHEHLQLLVNLYDEIEDREFKDIVFEHCIEQNILNRSIIEDYINQYADCDEGPLLNKAYYNLVKILIDTEPEDIDTIYYYIETYIHKFRDYLTIKRLLLNLFILDKEKCIELVSYILANVEVGKFKDIIKTIVKESIKRGYYNNLEYILQYVVNELEETGLRNIFINYIRKVPIDSEIKSKLILNTLDVYKNSILAEQIIDELYYKNMDEISHSIVYEIYKNTRDSNVTLRLQDKLTKFALSKPQEINDFEIVKHIVDQIKYDQEKMSIFVDSIKIEKFTEPSAIDYLYNSFLNSIREIKETEYALLLLNKVAPYHEGAKILVTDLLEDRVVNGCYVVDFENPIKALETGAVYRGYLVGAQDQEVKIVYINEEIQEVLDRYLDKKGIVHVKLNEDGLYLFENSIPLKSALANFDEVEKLRISCQLIGLQKDLLNRNYAFIEMYPEEVVLINQVPIMPSIYNLSSFMKYADYGKKHRYLKSKRKKIHEEDLIKIHVEFTKELFRENSKSASWISNDLEEKLKRAEYDSLSELENHLASMIEEAEYGRSDAFEYRRVMEYYHLQNNNKKLKLAQYILQQDKSNSVGNTDPFQVIMESQISPYSKLQYIMKNKRNQRDEVYKMIQFIITECGTIEEADEKLKRNVLSFIRGNTTNGNISSHLAREALHGLKFIGEEDLLFLEKHI